MTSPYGPVVGVHNISGARDLVLVCEHASAHVPEGIDLGLGAADLASHIAWDIGALGLATAMSDRLAAPLVHGRISRLIYDCNRPPEAHDAIPTKAETIPIPGNRNLSPDERTFRTGAIYQPFESALARLLATRPNATLVTVHTFTPVWFGAPRTVDIGLLHGEDPRLARAMMTVATRTDGRNVRLNEPYSSIDGVTHTIDLHGAATGRLNVMIEVRNDLVAAPADQETFADLLTGWIETALPLAQAERVIA